MKLSPLLLCLLFLGCTGKEAERKEIVLNGNWDLAKTGLSAEIPLVFPGRVAVPGLVDMSLPSLDEQDTAYSDALYWYRKSFKVNEEETEVALIKISKAKYHTRVYLNGRFIGENTYSFTPTRLDARPNMKFNGLENELIISVGCKDNLPDTVTHGADFEKLKYIPGIYDDVSLVLSGKEYISNIQSVPDIEKKQLRVRAEVQEVDPARWKGMKYSISELVSGKVVSKGRVRELLADEGGFMVDFTAEMPDCRFWTPGEPFLYYLELATSGDRSGNRFGMRSFAADPEKGRVLLNGRPYYMRGTNVCIFRFFEDSLRAGLPWDEEWASSLHAKFRDLNWNSIRYCIGFPPERWYEIADSLGFLIQDEYPVWTGTAGGYEAQLGGVSATHLADEYEAWMRERWNHPCVVIWDANNESVNDTTGKALEMVRALDLSRRPWDNGWAAPMRAGDVMETHPYIYVDYARAGYPSETGLLKNTLRPGVLSHNGPNERDPLEGGGDYPNATIINEYAWLWLNRDGTPTKLTKRLYENLFPDADTPGKRYEIYAKELAKQTEFWRANGTCAGVLHFCGLGYSRQADKDGFTSDNFVDVAALTFAPYFECYTSQAFSPAGVCLEIWDLKLKAGTEISFPVHVINDDYEKLEGKLLLSLSHQGNTRVVSEFEYALEGLDRKVFQSSLRVPEAPGHYLLQASIVYKGESIRSSREFLVN